MRDELNAPRDLCGGRRRELLRHGLMCRFMGREWRLLAGEEIEYALRECWRDGGGSVGGGEAFLDWVMEGDRLAEFLSAAMGMDSAADEFWDKLRGAVDELLCLHHQEMEVKIPGWFDDRPA
jgi:hypothetical protein